MAELLGALALGGGMVFYAVVFVLAISTPVMALSVTLNIRRIRMSLERLSNTAEAKPGWTPTGPLKI